MVDSNYKQIPSCSVNHKPLCLLTELLLYSQFSIKIHIEPVFNSSSVPVLTTQQVVMFSLSLSLASLALLFFVNMSHHAPTAQLQQPDSNAVDGPVPEIEKPMAQINNPLTSHILDTTLGLPAANVRCVLYKMGANGVWSQVLERHTDHDGRLKNLLTDAEFTPGIYKFYFDTKGYYESLRTSTFYPYVEIVFEITNPKQHYHVPLLLSPYGYSTYRGS